MLRSMSRLPDAVTMIRQLVACPSISSHDPALDRSNRAVVDLLAGWAESVGARVQVLDVPGMPGKANLLATFGPSDTGAPAGLVLSGHTDTVPCEPALWASDPFTAVEREGRLYGLGTADMKGFLALALLAAERVDHRRLRAPLVVLGTADEESGMAGARALVDAGLPVARHAVIGEPTGGQPIRMHKGVLMGAVDITGRSGHSSDPRNGVSAADGVAPTLAAIAALRQSWAERWQEPAFDVPVPTLNVGQIHGGDAPNRICGSCRLTFDVRLLPGMTPPGVMAELEARLRDALQGTRLGVAVSDICEPVPPFQGLPGSPVVARLERLTGRPSGTVAFATEAPHLASLGIDTVVCGPGHIEVAHQADEHLPLGDVAPTLRWLHALIHDLCGAL